MNWTLQRAASMLRINREDPKPSERNLYVYATRMLMKVDEVEKPTSWLMWGGLLLASFVGINALLDRFVEKTQGSVSGTVRSFVDWLAKFLNLDWDSSTFGEIRMPSYSRTTPGIHDRSEEVIVNSVPGRRGPEPLPSFKATPLSNVSMSVKEAIAYASQTVGISQPVIYAIANKESALGKYLVASTSSARGVLQLTSGTFAEMATKYGRQYGFGPGDVNDIRANVLAGTLYMRDLINIFKSRVRSSSPITVSELYLMYFLGPGAGVKFLRGLASDPDQLAAGDFPAAASANVNVFYRKVNGQNVPRTYQEIFNYVHAGVEAPAVTYAQSLPTEGNLVSINANKQLVETKQPTPASTETVQQQANVPKSLPEPTASIPSLSIPASTTGYTPSAFNVPVNATPSSVPKPQSFFRTRDGKQLAL